MLDYGQIECSKPKAQKHLNISFGLTDYPALIYFPLPRGKNLSESALVIHRIGDINNIIRKISDLIKDNSILIKDEEDIGFYTKKTFEAKKFPLILFYEKEGPLSMGFRALSNMKTFNHFFRFFKLKNASIGLKQQYKISTLPS